MNNMSTKTSKEKCGAELEMGGGFYMYCQLPKDGHIIHDSKPVSEGKECEHKNTSPNVIGLADEVCNDCGSKKYMKNRVTPPSNALRSEEWEEEFDQQFLQEVILDQEVRTVVKGIKLFITKLLTSERQRAYFEGVQNGINECKPEFDLARADERKKIGELIKKFCESKSWKEDAGNEVVQLEDILDYLSKLVKHQDK